jgi:hypothetical protein
MCKIIVKRSSGTALIPFLVVISRPKFQSLLHSIPRTFLFLLLLCLFGRPEAKAQVTIRGTVYNMFRTRPLEAVSVISTSGRGTITDSTGNYAITVNDRDSIFFSYLGRSTVKFPASMINTLNGFDISLHVNPTDLKEVSVMPRNYHMDSLQNRRDYAKAFDFRKPGLKLSTPTEGGSVGFDLDELINVFRFNRTRRMLAFQRRLVDEEHDKFIDHRFNRSIVKKITHLKDNDLDTFMRVYRPSYDFTVITTDYEFYDYIKLACQQYKINKNTRFELKKEQE